MTALCPHCGRAVIKSDNPEYRYQCEDCDEDFYGIECHCAPHLTPRIIHNMLVEAQGYLRDMIDEVGIEQCDSRVRDTYYCLHRIVNNNNDEE